MTFEQTLARHFKAVQERDLETFLDTVAQDGSLKMILPNGNLLDSYEEIVELHEDWFADTDWQLQAEPVTQYETADMGTALFLINYQDVDEMGQPVEFEYFLNLIFAKRDNKWVLIHDQNTIIEIDYDEEDG